MDTQEQLTKKEKYDIKRQERLAAKETTVKKHRIKKIVLWGLSGSLTIVLIGGLIWYVATRPPVPESDIVSRNGLHWHPELSVVIKGQKQEIPANLGLGATHQQVHTHDSTGVLHLEMQGLIRKDDIKLGRFFKIWGKQFNSNCIFESCNGADGKIKMLVNGQENTEFENYLMQDKDKIEIQYE